VIEYASRGIRVNAVSPGVIQTPMNAPGTYDALAAGHPVGRMGQVSDIVDGILFLESSPFITGEILHIDDIGADYVRAAALSPVAITIHEGKLVYAGGPDGRRQSRGADLAHRPGP
jgi:Enoyl-(Acyl carrier protein) reductase